MNNFTTASKGKKIDAFLIGNDREALEPASELAGTAGSIQELPVNLHIYF